MIEDKLTPEGERLLKELAKLDRLTVKVGILASDFKDRKLSPDGSSELVTLGEVAVFQEFGTKNIPERSYIRSTIEERREDWQAHAQVQIMEIFSGRSTAMEAAENMGRMMQRDIKHKIATLTDPELAEATLYHRRLLGITSDKPLIVTRQLYNSIKYEVVDAL